MKKIISVILAIAIFICAAPMTAFKTDAATIFDSAVPLAELEPISLKGVCSNYYSVSFPTAGKMRLRAEGFFTNWNKNEITLQLLDTDGNYIFNSYATYAIGSSYSIPKKGTYYLKITCTKDCNVLNGFYYVFTPDLTPTIKSAEISGTNSITLKWDAVSGATSYRVYRATSESGEKTYLGYTAGTSFTDSTAKTNDTIYYYYLASYNSATEKLSNYSDMKLIRFISLKPPTMKSAEISGTNSVKISWDAVSTATSYRVYRSTTATGAKTYLGLTGNTSFTDSTAKTSGQTYYYTVKAYSSTTKALSGFSASKSVKFYSMPAPVLTKAEIAGTNSVTVTWNAVSGATSYRVYRATSTTGTKTLLKVVAGTSYTDSSAKTNGQTYYYTVKAYSSKTTALSGFSASKSVEFYSMAAPTITSATAGSNGITIKWNAVTGATSYRVYRATSTTGAKTMLKVVADTSYTDTTAKSGTTYYYSLKAYSSKTTALSGFSASKSIKA